MGFHTESCEFPRTTKFKSRLFGRVKMLLKLDQNRYGVCPMYIESKTKRNFSIAFVGKSLHFIRKFAIISNKLRLLKFKKSSSSPGQRIVRIDPNSVRSIPYVPRVQNKKNAVACLGKSCVFIPKFPDVAKKIFKNMSFSSGQGVVQLKPNSVRSIPCVARILKK